MDKLKYIKLEQPDGSYSDSIPLAVDSDYVDVNGNTLTSELNNKATKAEVQAVASGSPAGVYATVAALTTADPDHSKIYIVTANGHWYYYNNSQWNDGGEYQATENSETVEELEENMTKLIDEYKVKNVPAININWYNASYDDKGNYYQTDDTILMPEWNTHYKKDRELIFEVNEGYIFNVFFFNSTSYNGYSYIGKAKLEKNSTPVTLDKTQFENMYYSIVLSRADGKNITPAEWTNVNVFRKVKLKTDNYVNIEEFGATKYTDSTEYIQNAIDFAIEHNKSVFIPEGVFYTKSLYLPSKTIIFGNGYNSVLKASYELNNHIINLKTNTTHLITLNNFRIDGNKSNVNGEYDGIHFENSKTEVGDQIIDHYHVFKNIHVENCKRNGIYMYYTREVLIDNCITRLNDENGIFFQGSDSKIINCTSAVNGKDGYHFITGCKIANCKAFFNTENGFYASSYCYELLMTNCDFQSNSQGGESYEIKLDGCNYSMLSNICLSIYTNGIYINGCNYTHINVVSHQGTKALVISSEPMNHNVIELFASEQNPIEYNTSSRYDSYIKLNGVEVYHTN